MYILKHDKTGHTEENNAIIIIINTLLFEEMIFLNQNN